MSQKGNELQIGGEPVIGYHVRLVRLLQRSLVLLDRLSELESHVLIHTGVEHVRTVKIPSFSLQSLRVC